MNKMEESFKKYCNYLSKFKQKLDETNPLVRLIEKYRRKKLDVYDFINKMNKYNKILYTYSRYLKNTDIERIEINDDRIIFTTRKDHIKLLFDGTDMRGVPFEILNWGEYEKEERKIYDKIITDEMIIFDVGANMGWYSILFSKKSNNSVIHSFEPIETTYKHCIENVKINNLKNVHVNKIGLSNKVGKETFFYSPETSVLTSSKNIINYNNMNKISCFITTLDSYVEKFKINCIDFIKCDVEGAELFVLKGGLQSIRNFQPILFLELFHEWTKRFGYHPSEVFDLLLSIGYEAYLPINGKLELTKDYIGQDFDKQNYFFLQKKKHQKIINRLC